jgi:acetyltransferase-like isoleucine patch superfamily enzyme
VFIGSGRLSIGRNVKINYGCFLDPYAGITLEKGVTLGPRCTLLTVSHRIGRPEMRRAPAGEDLLLEEIYVGEGSWLGASVTVLPGVRIGDGTVVGAGSVVLRNCEANAVYAGNPAALVRRLDSEVVPADDSEVVPADDGTAVNGD